MRSNFLFTSLAISRDELESNSLTSYEYYNCLVKRGLSKTIVSVIKGKFSKKVWLLMAALSSAAHEQLMSFKLKYLVLVHLQLYINEADGKQ